MTDLDETRPPLDGRMARRQRNVDAVLDAVLEMFAENSMFPTIEQAAKRSGLSLRSLYRYFDDPGTLLEATIKRSDQIGLELSRLHAIGEGPLDQRIDQFVAMRLRLHDGIGPVYRATQANAARLPRIGDELTRNRARMRDQFELHFAPELDRLDRAAAAATLAAGDLLTQLESIIYLANHREMSNREIHAAISAALHALLD